MSTDDSNPYQVTAIDPKPGAPRGSIEYMRAVHYVFESPKWMANLLWGSLCILTTQAIPIVGHLVWMGYQFEIVEALLTRSSRAVYPDFDTGRFKDYLVRGLWIFLATLVVSLVMLPIVFILIGVCMVIMGVVGAASGGNEEAMTIGMIIMLALMMVVMFVFWVLMILALTPFMIRAGLTQDFKATFDFAWIKDFVSKMWVETLLSTLFLVAVAVPVEILGLLACFVGLFPAVAFLILVQGHLMLQLYQLYLARGGQKVPLKSPPIKPAQATS